MLSICTYARSQSLSPLVNGRVNNVLLQTVRDINKALLQLTDSVHTTFIHSLLDLRSSGFRTGLFGGQISGPMK